MARFAGSVLIDCNAIGDAVDLGVWNGLLGAYRLETVSEVEGEAGSYFRRKPDATELMASMARVVVHMVSDAERAALGTRSEIELDAGERDLWAHLIQREDVWLLCGPDQASVRAAVQLGLKDRIVSLEQLLEDAGLSTKRLPFNQTRKWLDQKRSQFVVEGTHK